MSKTAEEIGLIVGGLALGGIRSARVILGCSRSASEPAHSRRCSELEISATLSGIGQAIRQAPRPVATSGSVALQDGPAPRRVIYGQFQTAGVLTYASFPPSQNLATTAQYLHLVYTISGHEISSFDGVSIDGTMYNFAADIYFDGSISSTTLWQVNPNGAGTDSDFYWEHLFFEFDFGRADDYFPFPNLYAADSSWTRACVQWNCAKVHVVLRADSGWNALFASGRIPNFQFLVTGKKLIDPRVITAWQPSTGYLKYQYILDDFGNLWWQTNTSGTSGSTRPNFEHGAGPLTDGTCSWTDTGLGQVAISGGADANPQGHIVNGRLVNDAWAPGLGYGPVAVIEAPLGYLQMITTTGTGGASEPAFATTLGATTTDGTQVFTCLGRSWHAINPSNPALCVYDYLMDTDAGLGVAAAAIDVSSVIGAANLCEDTVPIIVNADSTVVYENQYSCNGMFDHSAVRGNVLQGLCGSMAGWVIPPGDFWHVFAGAFVTPTVALTDNDMRGPVKGDFRLSKRDVANGVKGKYVPAFLPTNPGGELSMTQVPGIWQSQSFPAYQANGLAGKPNYLNSEDAGQIIWQDVSLDFCTSLWLAQRLAKITLMRLRFQETLTLPCKMTAFAIEAGDTIYFNHSRWGTLGSYYQVSQCSITFDSGGGKDGVPVVGVDLTVRQVDPSIYTFQGPTSASDFGEYSPFGITGVMTGVE